MAYVMRKEPARLDDAPGLWACVSCGVRYAEKPENCPMCRGTVFALQGVDYDFYVRSPASGMWTGERDNMDGPVAWPESGLVGWRDDRAGVLLPPLRGRANSPAA